MQLLVQKQAMQGSIQQAVMFEVIFDIFNPYQMDIFLGMAFKDSLGNTRIGKKLICIIFSFHLQSIFRESYYSCFGYFLKYYCPKRHQSYL